MEAAPKPPERGKLKVFLGMAAGVGKTYRMLQEGHSAAAAKVDVVVGYVETHGRSETAAQIGDLEVLPRQIAEYRGAELEELDLAAIIERRPQLCLIDELAHTNAPGVKNKKRYEDVREVLDAGIDVYSTVNVQHLESLNDQVAELCGVRMRETIPDAVLGDADELVIVDLSPEGLLNRLREGKVYPGERAAAALTNFFKIENLQALRGLALRQVADDVVARRAHLTVDPRPGELAKAAGDAVSERMLALFTPRPHSQRLVRRAWRSAMRLGAKLDLLWVKQPGRGERGEELEQLDAIRNIAALLGANVIVETGDDVAQIVAQVVRERGVTYVLVGESSPQTGLKRLGEPLPQRIMRLAPGVDVRIVADRSRRVEEQS